VRVEEPDVEQWKAEVCALLLIPREQRTEDERRRVWARRVRLLLRGWRVVLEKDEIVLQYIGNAEGRPECWDEIRKDEIWRHES
jgi:hypothetical protein